MFAQATDWAGFRADWARRKVAEAVRAMASQHAFGAIAAKGTFVRADERVFALWWQILVAAFAVWAKVKHSHGVISPGMRDGSEC